MCRFRLAAAVLAAGVTAAVGSAQPQPTGGPTAPQFGSYLNLINRGGSPALNYFGIIRPQQQLAQQQQQLGQQQRQLGQQQQQMSQDIQAAEYGIYGQSVFGYDRRLRQTGFIPTFNNTGHYFSTNPALGAGGGGTRASGTGIGTGGGSSQVGLRAAFAGANLGAGAGGGRGAVGGGGVRR